MVDLHKRPCPRCAASNEARRKALGERDAARATIEKLMIELETEKLVATKALEARFVAEDELARFAHGSEPTESEKLAS
jgi:DNA-binding transcriptional regulator YhcF (GntR family)